MGGNDRSGGNLRIRRLHSWDDIVFAKKYVPKSLQSTRFLIEGKSKLNETVATQFSSRSLDAQKSQKKGQSNCTL